MPDPLDDNYLNHLVMGDGSEVCLAFHGFGQSPEVMKYLSEPPEFHFKVISIALHYHGNSASPITDSISIEEMKVQIEKILKQHHVKEFHLAGFSIGARLALCLYPEMAERVKSLWLFAPDGLPVSASYRLATQNLLGKNLFRWFLRFGLALRFLLNVSKILKITDKKTTAYFLNELKTKSLRNRIFYTWMFYRKLIPDMQAIKNAQQTNGLKITVVSGKYDRVIPLKRIKKFMKNNGVAAHFISIPHGHNLMSTKAFRRLGEFVQERVGAF